VFGNIVAFFFFFFSFWIESERDPFVILNRFPFLSLIKKRI
jgi:hypothetical protein